MIIHITGFVMYRIVGQRQFEFDYRALIASIFMQ